MDNTQKARVIERFKGLTADDMNYRARTGRVNKSDLEQWAEVQNDYCVSIQWYVAEYVSYRGSLAVVVPELRDRSI